MPSREHVDYRVGSARDRHLYCMVNPRTRRILDPNATGQWKNGFARHRGCHRPVKIFCGPESRHKQHVAYLDYRTIITAV